MGNNVDKINKKKRNAPAKRRKPLAKKKISQAVSKANEKIVTDRAKEGMAEDFSWDLIHGLHSDLANGLVTMGSSITEMLRIPKIVDFISPEQSPKLKIQIDQLQRDLVKYSERMKGLKETYVGKAGSLDSKDEDELFSYIAIMDEYKHMSEQFFAIVVPVHAEITGTIELANIAMHKELNSVKKEGEDNV